MISPVREPAPMDGTRCRRRRRWPQHSVASASAPARRWLPTTRMRDRTQAVSGGCCAISDMTRSRCSTAGGPSGFARGDLLVLAKSNARLPHSRRAFDQTCASRLTRRRRASAIPACCSSTHARRSDSRGSPIHSTTCPGTFRAPAIVFTRTTWQRMEQCAHRTRSAPTSRASLAIAQPIKP